MAKPPGHSGNHLPRLVPEHLSPLLQVRGWPDLKMKTNQIIGLIGLIVLVFTVTLSGQIQRILWAISGVFLLTYSLIKKDWINASVNFWITSVNLYYLL